MRLGLSKAAENVVAQPELSPAEKVIRAAGGVGALAKLLEIDRVWIWRWTKPKEKRGCDGEIPAPQRPRCLALSRAHNWGLTASDIFGCDMGEAA